MDMEVHLQLNLFNMPSVRIRGVSVLESCPYCEGPLYNDTLTDY